MPPSRSVRFPGFDVLSQREHWDARTREVVMARVRPAWRRSFFTAAEEPAARALCTALLALAGSPSEPPVFEMVDGRLAEGITDGWHYDDMPLDSEAWRRSLAELRAAGFDEMTANARDALIENVKRSPRFGGMPGMRLFDLWMRYVCTAYYAHPAAWNEIGFGGPAYPRGYKAIGVDRREPWEVADAASTDPVPIVSRAERQQEQRSGRRRAG